MFCRDMRCEFNEKEVITNSPQHCLNANPFTMSPVKEIASHASKFCLVPKMTKLLFAAVRASLSLPDSTKERPSGKTWSRSAHTLLYCAHAPSAHKRAKLFRLDNFQQRRRPLSNEMKRGRSKNKAIWRYIKFIIPTDANHCLCVSVGEKIS